MAHVPLTPSVAPVTRSPTTAPSTTTARNTRPSTPCSTRAAPRWPRAGATSTSASTRRKLTARERVELLKDAGTRTFEVGTFVNYDVGFGDKGMKCPGAGVVTAFTRVEGRWCMVIANDNKGLGLVVAQDPREDRARADHGAAPAHPHHLPRGLLGAVFARAIQELPRGHRRRTHLQEKQPALGARRAAAGGGVRRLHRRGRLHAHHLRPGLHDRTGLHGHRRRRAHQGRQVPEDHQPRHRRPRGARASKRLRRRARPQRRGAHPLPAPRGAKAPHLRRGFTGTSAARWPGLRRPRARRACPRPRGLRRQRGARAPV